MLSSVLPLPLVTNLAHHAAFVGAFVLLVFLILSSSTVPLTMFASFVLALFGPFPPPSDAIHWQSPIEQLAMFLPLV